jgi:hypothetical protein
MSQEDIAQAHEAFDWALNNRPRTLATTFAPADKGYGPATCNGRVQRTAPGVQLEDDCGEELPPLRRAMGRHLCVGCQDLLERGRLRR